MSRTMSPILVIGDPLNKAAGYVPADRIRFENLEGQIRKSEFLEQARSRNWLRGGRICVRAFAGETFWTRSGRLISFKSVKEAVEVLEYWVDDLYTGVKELHEGAEEPQNEKSPLRKKKEKSEKASNKSGSKTHKGNLVTTLQSENSHLRSKVKELNAENARLKRTIEVYVTKLREDAEQPFEQPVLESSPEESENILSEERQSDGSDGSHYGDDDDEPEPKPRKRCRHQLPDSEPDSESDPEPPTKRQRQKLQGAKPRATTSSKKIAATPSTLPSPGSNSSARGKMPSWSNLEKSALAVAVIDIHGRRALRDMSLFDRVSRSLQSQNIGRSAVACKLQWNREGRAMANYDERQRGKKDKLQTSVQK